MNKPPAATKTRTTVIKASDVSRQWYVVDASTAPLGRVSTKIATYLIGKQKPSYTPHIDNGDYIVVINADQLQVSSENKLEQKKYYRHSQYPGSLKTTTLQEQLSAGKSYEVIRAAVKGMLPKNKLHSARLARLRVFSGSEHHHTAQNPKQLEIG